MDACHCIFETSPKRPWVGTSNLEDHIGTSPLTSPIVFAAGTLFRNPRSFEGAVRGLHAVGLSATRAACTARRAAATEAEAFACKRARSRSDCGWGRGGWGTPGTLGV